jgi:predicted nucleic acid-binding protein
MLILRGYKMTAIAMYLLDTNIISELRKQGNANIGVQQFMQTAIEQAAHLYISVITLGELRRGVELVRYRGDQPQADRLEAWLSTIVADYADHILDFTATEAQIWCNIAIAQPVRAMAKS